MSTPHLDKYLMAKALTHLEGALDRKPNLGELVDELVQREHYSAAEHTLRTQAKEMARNN